MSVGCEWIGGVGREETGMGSGQTKNRKSEDGRIRYFCVASFSGHTSFFERTTSRRAAKNFVPLMASLGQGESRIILSRPRSELSDDIKDECRRASMSSGVVIKKRQMRQVRTDACDISGLNTFFTFCPMPQKVSRTEVESKAMTTMHRAICL